MFHPHLYITRLSFAAGENFIARWRGDENNGMRAEDRIIQSISIRSGRSLRWCNRSNDDREQNCNAVYNSARTGACHGAHIGLFRLITRYFRRTAPRKRTLRRCSVLLIVVGEILVFLRSWYLDRPAIEIIVHHGRSHGVFAALLRRAWVRAE